MSRGGKSSIGKNPLREEERDATKAAIIILGLIFAILIILIVCLVWLT